MTYQQAWQIVQQSLEPHFSSETWLFLEPLLKKDKPSIIAQRHTQLTQAEQATLERWLEQRQQGVPVQYITGEAHFYGLKLVVTPAVLIPRPETEVLVHAVVACIVACLKSQPQRDSLRVLDVGTGSGAIALAIKENCPQVQVWGSDVSTTALEVARQNAKRLDLDVAFVLSDLLAAAAVADFAREADVIVANLPYLPEQDREKIAQEVRLEPATALFAGDDGLAIWRRLEAEACSTLKTGASLYSELDPRNVHQAATLAAAQNWQTVSVTADLVGRERFLCLIR